MVLTVYRLTQPSCGNMLNSVRGTVIIHICLALGSSLNTVYGLDILKLCVVTHGQFWLIA
jgi:hypothetical protein